VLVSIELQFLCSDSGFCQLPLFFIGGLFAVASKLKVLEDDCWTMNHRLHDDDTQARAEFNTRHDTTATILCDFRFFTTNVTDFFL